MALGKDENKKNSTSYKPYDVSNSFVKRIANRVTDFLPWRSNTHECNDQNPEDSVHCLSNDDETVSPTPKRIKIYRETDPYKFSPKAVPSIDCSSIQSINDITAAGSSFRNVCVASSTPAPLANYCDDDTPESAGKVMDYLDKNASSSVSTKLPSIRTHNRHNVTIPTAYQKEIPSSAKFELNRSLIESSSAANQRSPSFNAEILSASSKRLSLSVCENRSKGCLSPFYSARTMYGGASALLPYSIQSGSRLRTESTSRLNIFSPREKITIQPIASPQRGAGDQETMSAAARRILDTLEKYCSPVKDAKRMPINESSVKSENDINSFTSRGVKRKLPALTPMIPSTTDLLRIKRQEKIQDSVLNARQVVSNVPQISTTPTDSDSSSDSVDLDYTVFNENSSKNSEVGQFSGKIKRKHEARVNHKPPVPVKLPNAVLKITNLPKFSITDTFTFSKPLLLENLDNAEEENTKKMTEPVATTTTNVYANKSSKSNAEFTVSAKNSTELSPVKRSVITATDAREGAKSFTPPISASESRVGFIKTDTKQSNSKLYFLNDVSKSSNSEKISRWTCKKCLLENSGEKCSSCSSSRQADSNRVEFDDKKIPAYENVSNESFLFKREQSSGGTSSGNVTAGIGVSSNVTNRNEINTNFGNVAVCSSSQNGSTATRSDNVVGTKSTVTSDSVDGATKSSEENVSPNPSELWKNLQKKADDTWKCDDCWISNKKTDAKCVACGASNKLLPVSAAAKTEASKPAFTFGISGNESKVAGSAAKGVQPGDDSKQGTGFTFGFGSIGGNTNLNSSTNTNSSAAPTATVCDSVKANTQFSFGFATTANTNHVATSASTNDENSVKNATTPSFTFGSIGKAETPSPANNAAPTSVSKSFPSFGAAVEASKIGNVDKACLTKGSEGATFSDVTSSTSNKKNSFFMSTNSTGESLANSNSFKPSVQLLSNASSADNVQDSAASTPNDITSSTEIPNKKKHVTFSSLFNKDTVNSTSVFGSNGLPDSDFKLPSTTNVTAVSSSNNVFMTDFSTSTSTSAIVSSKINDGQFSGLASENRDFGDNSNGRSDTNSGGNRTAATVSSQAAGSFDGTSATKGLTASTENKNIAMFSGHVNHSGGSVGNMVNHFNVSSSESSNSVFGSFGGASNAKVSDAPTTVAHLPTASTTTNFNSPATPFRFGMGAPSNTQTTGGFSFNGPKMDNDVPRFGFATSNNAFGTGSSPFTFNSAALATTSSENSLPAGSVFSSSKMPLREGGQPSATKSPLSFGNSSAGFVANSVSSTAKKSGGFSFSGGQPMMNSFSGFSAAVNDNQDQNNFNSSNSVASTPFVFGSLSNQTGQSHNFSMTVPPTFNFTGGNSVPSFTAQPVTNAVSVQPGRKIKKAVRRTNK